MVEDDVRGVLEISKKWGCGRTIILNCGFRQNESDVDDVWSMVLIGGKVF